MKKVLLAFNSFKEVADSVKICNLMNENLKGDVECLLRPISDGGDGFLEVCKNIFKLNELTYEVKSFYDDSYFNLRVGIEEKSATAYFETASAIGLKLIPNKKRAPNMYNSKALGEIVKKILTVKKIKTIVFGVGGTATMDMGLGFCEAFGLRAVDKVGAPLSLIPSNFAKIEDIYWEQCSKEVKFICITDVDNPLLGRDGGFKIYGKQKGASLKDIKLIEAGVLNILELFEKKGFLQKTRFLSGAGGGFAAGLQILLNAQIISSEDFIKDNLITKNFLTEVDAVITGEGAFDKQSFYKKGAGVIVDLFKNSGKKIFLCCGEIEDEIINMLPSYVYPIELRKFFNSKKESIINYKIGLQKASREIVKVLNS